MTALLYVLLFVSLAAIIANWIAGRIRKRNDRASEQLAETDRDWRCEVPQRLWDRFERRERVLGRIAAEPAPQGRRRVGLREDEAA